MGGLRRSLRTEEIELIRLMISGSALREQWEHAQVEDMLDGGMGSIRFVGQSGHRHLGAVMREASYVDTDGVDVQISINLDREGLLFEVDFWKVDFSPLRRYPTTNEIIFSQSNRTAS